MITMYTPTEAAIAMKTPREVIDIACESGALEAVDDSLDPRSTKRRWRISEDALLDWHRRGRPRG